MSAVVPRLSLDTNFPPGKDSMRFSKLLTLALQIRAFVILAYNSGTPLSKSGDMASIHTWPTP